MDCARRVAAELEAAPVDLMTALGLGILYGHLGDMDRAFHWLNREPAHVWLPWVRVTQKWSEPLDGDPRYDALLERMDLSR